MKSKFLSNYRSLKTLFLTSSFLVLPSSALSAPFSSDVIIKTAPLLIVFGALGFGIIGSFFARRAFTERKKTEEEAFKQIANMRASLDDYEILLAGLPQIIITWSQFDEKPTIHGQGEIVYNESYSANNVLDFNSWLNAPNCDILNKKISLLKTEAQNFEICLNNKNNQTLRINGYIIGGQATIRIRKNGANLENSSAIENLKSANFENTKTILSLFEFPSFIKNNEEEIIFTNVSFNKLEKKLGGREKIKNLIKENNDKKYNLNIFDIENGTAGILIEQKITSSLIKENEEINTLNFEHLEAIDTPIIIFDNKQKVKSFNKAYCELWDLSADWLNSGIDEKSILNHLHTKTQLPSTANYRLWRDEHLKSYKLTSSREQDWYLPNGVTLKVSAVPASQNNGVIYIYENITERRNLETQHNALINVQRETLNALSEGVAVFGTNGLLTLSNPRLSLMFKLPMNELGTHPHIDKITKSCAASMPQDGEKIWAEFKKVIIDLNPNRSDKSDRLKLTDGRLIDYSITKLPDGKTMLTFVDVTQSASYEKILKERNDALVVADRLKDAFVKNVSYELRSPLTNIIGFADLLVSGTVGKLNEKQKEYANYISNSSQSLGILIDNILDLANADAGILKLNYEEQDVLSLVERAKAGLIGSLNSKNGETAVNLEVNIDDNLPEFFADGTRLTQVLYNLLSNASRFSDAGSEIKLNISSRNKRIIFVIEDEGIGINEEMKAALFTRFEGKAEKGRQKGAGLGLAIVKTFVNLHGGTVSLESRKPKGTRVIVSIPLNATQAMSG